MLRSSADSNYPRYGSQITGANSKKSNRNPAYVYTERKRDGVRVCMCVCVWESV